MFLGSRLEMVRMVEVKAGMGVAGRIRSLPHAVFEMGGVAVLFVFWQRLGLRSFQIHHKSRTNLVRQPSPMLPSG